jgi:type I restriction enzyme, S subunit
MRGASVSGDLRPYASYKDTQELGAIPHHWETRRLDRLFVVRSETPLEADGRVTGYLDGRVTLRSNVVGQKIKGVIKEAGWQRVHPGDFAISGMNAHLGGMGVSDSLGKCSPIYLVLKPTAGTNALFVSYAVRNAARNGLIKAMVNTIRFNSADLKREDLKRLWVQIPPESEQAAIVRFLDHADRRIQRYIRAKKKLIALLNEQKQAIIHRAVTRGLDPNVRLKSSGVEWLGDVPEHWETSRLKFETSHIVDCVHATPQYVDDGQYPAIRTADVEPGHVRLGTARKISGEQYELWTSRLVPQAGDILYSREGERFGIAAPVPSGVKLCISQRMVILRVRPPNNALYIMWQLNCGHVYAQGAADVIGAAAPHVNLERIRNYSILLPSPREQEAISGYIASETASLLLAEERLTREIGLLREYRTRLISDVVTGKLDVRQAAANLTDDELAAEPFYDLDPLDEIAEYAEEADIEAEALPV